MVEVRVKREGNRVVGDCAFEGKGADLLIESVVIIDSLLEKAESVAGPEFRDAMLIGFSATVNKALKARVGEGTGGLDGKYAS